MCLCRVLNVGSRRPDKLHYPDGKSEMNANLLILANNLQVGISITPPKLMQRFRVG